MMYKHFTAEFFRGNREHLRSLFSGTAPIILTANGLLQRNGDSSFPFRQDSNFWYVTGIDEPDVILIMDKQKEYLIIPEHDSSKELFDGVIDVEKLKKVSGIKTVLSEKEGWKVLGARLKRVKHIATMAPPPAYIDHYGMYSNPARAMLVHKIRAVKEDIQILDLKQHFSRMRMVKQEPELAALQTAIDITTKTLKTAIKKPYQYEYELEAYISQQFRKMGASGHGYSPIIAGGGRACVLHNMSNNAKLRKRELVLVDVGAEVENYTADITRTFGTEMTRRQHAVLEAVAQVQEYAFGLMKPGALLRQNELKVEQFMGEKLRELNLIKIIKHETVREFFPHATSHFLGLDAHDSADYDRPLEPGMVLTVEPGIYIPEEKIGVRIEDDVVITEDGCRVMSESLPRILG